MKYSSNDFIRVLFLFLFVGMVTVSLNWHQSLSIVINRHPPSVFSSVSGILNPYLPEILPYASLRSAAAAVVAASEVLKKQYQIQIHSGYTP